MKLDSHLSDLRKLIDKRLDKYLPSELCEPRVIHKAMRYAVFSGGKRLRPIVVVESSRACGGDIKDAVTAGCAVELVHTYSLVHDDLPSMDDDDYRRGKPSSHKMFGEANAILAGDALLTLAFNVIANGLGAKTGMEAIRELSEAIGTRGMVGGQAADIDLRDRKKTKNILNHINRLKTSKLFEVSAKLGAIVAGSDPRAIKALAGYGARLGMAFQIIDDIADGGYYAQLLGAKKGCRDAEALIRDAKSSLKIFGMRAERLKKIANDVLARAKIEN